MSVTIYDQYTLKSGHSLDNRESVLENMVTDVTQIGVSDLQYTSRESHPLSKEATATVGFLGRLFSGTGKVVKRGLIEETKWYTNVEVDGKTLQYGVSVRLAVAATSISLDDFSLTLPNLSAAAQLGFTEARAGIYTHGFNGFSPTLSPDKLDLSVENFADFKEAYNKTVAHVFAPESRAMIKPALLMEMEL